MEIEAFTGHNDNNDQNRGQEFESQKNGFYEGQSSDYEKLENPHLLGQIARLVTDPKTKEVHEFILAMKKVIPQPENVVPSKKRVEFIDISYHDQICDDTLYEGTTSKYVHEISDTQFESNDVKKLNKEKSKIEKNNSPNRQIVPPTPMFQMVPKQMPMPKQSMDYNQPYIG